MIINLRGTSGSGKSTIARWLLGQGVDVTLIRKEGRKQPLYYRVALPSGEVLAVLGHYETPCGGCDTLPSFDFIVDLVKELAAGHDHVFYEGLLISCDSARTLELHREVGEGILVLSIDNPLEECVASVNKRRWAKDPTKPGVLDDSNIAANWRTIRRAHDKLVAAGVPAELLSREDCRRRIAERILGDADLSSL